jgi:hypothetical protein
MNNREGSYFGASKANSPESRGTGKRKTLVGRSRVCGIFRCKRQGDKRTRTVTRRDTSASVISLTCPPVARILLLLKLIAVGDELLLIRTSHCRLRCVKLDRVLHLLLCIRTMALLRDFLGVAMDPSASQRTNQIYLEMCVQEILTLLVLTALQRCDYCLKGGAIITCVQCRSVSVCVGYDGVPGCLDNDFALSWQCPVCCNMEGNLPAVCSPSLCILTDIGSCVQYPIPCRAPGMNQKGSNSNPLILYNVYHDFQEHVGASVRVLETQARTRFIGKVIVCIYLVRVD